MGHEQSLMFGQYRQQLANFALVQAQKTKQLQEERMIHVSSEVQDPSLGNRLKRSTRRIIEMCGDWFILATLAIIVALLSFIMDIVIHMCFEGLCIWCFKNSFTPLFFYSFFLSIIILTEISFTEIIFYPLVRQWLISEVTDIFMYKYIIWIVFTVTLIMISAILVRVVSPQAAGSGVAEMKVILRGVVLKGIKLEFKLFNKINSIIIKVKN